MHRNPSSIRTRASPLWRARKTQFKQLVLSPENPPSGTQVKSGLPAKALKGCLGEIIAVLVEDVPRAPRPDDPLETRCLDKDWRSAAATGDLGQVGEKTADRADVLDNVPDNDRIGSFIDSLGTQIFPADTDVGKSFPRFLVAGVITGPASPRDADQPSEKNALSAADLENMRGTAAYFPGNPESDVRGVPVKGGGKILLVFVGAVVRNGRSIERGIEDQAAGTATNQLDVAASDAHGAASRRKAVI